MTRPNHDLSCVVCGRSMASLTAFNATKVAMECKCSARLTVHVNQDGTINPTYRKRDRPPAWYELLDTDAARLRESSMALRDLRVQQTSVDNRIGSLTAMRGPWKSAERERLMKEAMSSRVMAQHGGDPMAAMKAVLEQMDPDSAREILEKIMEGFR